MKKEFRSFDDARKFVHTLHLSSARQWKKYCKSGNKPIDIPSQPYAVYKNKGWVNWSDWFGKSFLSYDDAKKDVQKLGLRSHTEWVKFRQSGKRPKNIPSNPSDFYKKEFKGYGDFLGTGTIANQNREFLSYDNTKKIIKKYKIHTQKEYRNLAKIGKLPKNFPRDPQKSYEEFQSWGDFLGTGKIANQNREFLSYERAKDEVRKLGITTLRKWQNAVSIGSIPKNIPTLPSRTYKKEWMGWGDFLGTGTIAPLIKSKNWLPWSDAKSLYRKIAKENNLKNLEDWKKYVKTHKLPKGLPPHPADIYTKERIRKMMK
jgi:hypothetical protein